MTFVKNTIIPGFLIMLLVCPVPDAFTALDTEKVKQLVQTEKYEDAQKLLSRHLAKNEKDHLAMFQMGQIKLKIHEIDSAIYWFKRASDFHDSDYRYFYWLGRAKLTKLQVTPIRKKRKLAKEVEACFIKSIELNPMHIYSRVYLGDFYLTAPPIAGGNRKKAFEQLEFIKQCDPVKGKFIAARFYIREKEYDKAETELKELIERNQLVFEAHELQGKIHEERDDFELAIKEYKKASELEPSNLELKKQIERLESAQL